MPLILANVGFSYSVLFLLATNSSKKGRDPVGTFTSSKNSNVTLAVLFIFIFSTVCRFKAARLVFNVVDAVNNPVLFISVISKFKGIILSLIL